MRPRGEIRQTIGKAAAELVRERIDRGEAGAATWRDLAQRACVGYGAARETVRNMVRAGELQLVDEVRVPHARRPMGRYAPAASPAPQQQQQQQHQHQAHSWQPSPWSATGWETPATLATALGQWRG